MGYSAIKVIGETAAIYVGGNAVSLILLSALGGPGQPLAVNLSGLILTVIWATCVGWVYKRDSLDSVWTWEKASPAARVRVAVMVIAFIVGRGASLRDIFPGVQMVFRPSESVRLDMCVFAPIREEVLWRGFLLRRLSPIVGTWPAIAISAAAFGLLHSNPLSATAMGALLGWLYSPLGTGNLYVAMLVHALANLTSKVPF